MMRHETFWVAPAAALAGALIAGGATHADDRPAFHERRIEITDDSFDPTLEQLVAEHFEIWFKSALLSRQTIPGHPDGASTGVLRIRWGVADPSAFTAVAFRNVKWTQATTSAGETLRVRDSAGHIADDRYARGRYFDLRMEPPRIAGAGRLERLRGTMEVYVLRDAFRYVALGPVEEVRGEPIHLPDFDEQVRIGFLNDGRFVLRHSWELASLLPGIRSNRRSRADDDAFAFYDGQGNRLGSDGGSGTHMHQGDIMRRFNHDPPPPDGYLQTSELFRQG